MSPRNMAVLPHHWSKHQLRQHTFFNVYITKFGLSLKERVFISISGSLG